MSEYKSIDELIAETPDWKPGSLNIIHENFTITSFSPYFKDIHGYWHGLNQDGKSLTIADGPYWKLYTPPKRTVRLYQWAVKFSGADAWMLDDDLASSETEVRNSWAEDGIEAVRRIDNVYIDVEVDD